MEPIFINRITFTKEIHYELSKATFNRIRLLTSILLGVFLTLFTIIAFISAKFGLFTVLALITVLAFAQPYITTRLTAKRGYDQRRLLNNGQDIQNTTEFSENIKITSLNKGEIFFQYEQIKRIYETKRLFILGMGHSVYIVLQKDGFSASNADTFRDFIRDRCPNILFIYR